MKNIKPQLQKLVQKLRGNVVLIVILIIGGMYGYLIYTSGKLADEQPSEKQITEKYQGTPRPKIDDSVAQKLEELEDQNIEVQALFDEARNNPFAE